MLNLLDQIIEEILLIELILSDLKMKTTPHKTTKSFLFSKSSNSVISAAHATFGRAGTFHLKMTPFK